ncbi:hypothetical protein ACMU_15510 [Actibacterium mucosum KCTC 23349]|uniref:Hedgehog/Intein (Hint) domain-containing protein n=1 Tax=Actibacterium mucosum KCTC 23349 TaxID=1454373 RepID=A0A037ZHY1_9RHOB|nr:Hint domain-containing protein [Actibacterium mucosum]KAJ55162.1 hypothetical protein ACMU_15510 [Actibacterium mucosum KCTC 23349]
MGHQRHTTPPRPATVPSRPSRVPQVQRKPALARAMPLTRRYEIQAIDVQGALTQKSAVAPATPTFEDAFAGFARGTLITTTDGPIAVEDLCPGMQIVTKDNGPMPLLWIGSMMVFPGLPELSEESVRLLRVTAESFGMGRPLPDLMLGPRARVLFQHDACRRMFGTPSAFAPAHGFADGESMITIQPVAPVRVYHVAVEGQQVLSANGLEVESFHPGARADDMMDAETLDLFLSLFPHVRSIHEFGPMSYPRLSAHEVEMIRVDAA